MMERLAHKTLTPPLLFLCWFGGLNVTRKNILNKEVNVCGKAVGERQEHLSQLYERRVVWKARVIL